MKPVQQTRFGGSDAPEDKQGNCLAASLASAFELELHEVPDFAGHINDHSWFELLQSWLAERNLQLFPGTLSKGYPRGTHLMACKSTTLKNPEDGHVIVIQDGQQIHDPNPNAVKEAEPEEYWVFAVLDPAKQKVIV